MRSPFPGMDPFIEEFDLFEDFHNKLISEIERKLSDIVPDRYVVRTAERPYVAIVEPDGKSEHTFKPDIGVTTNFGPHAAIAATTATAVAEPGMEMDAAPVSMRAFVAEDFRESFIEVYLTQPERVLVTSIEVLSPSNKRRGSQGWEIYLRKRQALLLGAANLVEIDLLRGGEKFPMIDDWPASPYSLLVSRRDRPGRCQVWPGHFRFAIPAIPIPLASPDADVTLALQPMIDAIFLRSRYERDIDYSRQPAKAFSPEDQAWLTQRLS